MVQIGLAVALLLSLFATYLNTKTWRVPQVIFAFLVFLAGAVAWFMGAATLKMHDSWRSSADVLEKKVQQATAEAEALREGTEDESLRTRLQNEEPAFAAGGVKKLRDELEMLTYGRGRVWRNTTPDVPAEDGTVQVGIETPTPHDISPNQILFVFEQGAVNHDEQANPPVYLGEFKVTEAGEAGIQLAPALELSEAELTRLRNSQGPWIIYEVMPQDRTDLFADMTDAELRSLFPKTAEQYIRDGGPARDDDPEEHVVDGTYHRPLRDYRTRLREIHLQQHENRQRKLQLETDTKLMQDAVAQAEKDIEFRKQQIADLQYDLEQFEARTQVAKAHFERVQRALSAVEKRLEETRKSAVEKAAELVRLQAEAADRVKRRLSSTTASEPGPKAIKVELVEQ